MNPPPYEDRLSLPVVAAPMFLISGPKLVTEACKNGVVGTFPALNQRSTEGFDAWLHEIEETLDGATQAGGRPPAPYGVNLIVHRTNPRLEADLEVVVRHRVPIVITSLGAVSELVDAVHGYGGLVYHDVTNRRHAEKAAGAGVDGPHPGGCGRRRPRWDAQPDALHRRDALVLRRHAPALRLYEYRPRRGRRHADGR